MRLIRRTIRKCIQAYFAILFVLIEVFDHWKKKLLEYLYEPTGYDLQLQTLNTCSTYDEWCSLAKNIDEACELNIWKSNPISQHYDYNLIYETNKKLRECLNSKDIFDSLEAVRFGLLRNLGGINDPKLHSFCYYGTKTLIEKYLQNMNRLINRIEEAKDEDLSFQLKLDFFHDAKLAHGSTALILNGGSNFGLYHIGVVKTLHEQNILPKIISGSEVGSLVAAAICIHTDSELKDSLSPEAIDISAFGNTKKKTSLRKLVLTLIKDGYLMNIKRIEKCAKDNIGDYTFEEAFLKTDRVLNIVVGNSQISEIPPLLNYITAPNVLIRSAACFSTSVYGLYGRGPLLIKNQDGQIIEWNLSEFSQENVAVKELEQPIKRLSELFNVNHFIVSQAYPYTLPFLSRDIRMNQNGLMSKLKNLLYSEFRHRLFQLEQFKILPRILRGIIDQKFAGHVTLFPNVKLDDFYTLFSYPDKESLKYWILVGERTTWPVVQLIKNRCEMEFNFERICKELKKKNPTKSPHEDSFINLLNNSSRRRTSSFN